LIDNIPTRHAVEIDNDDFGSPGIATSEQNIKR